MMEDKKPNTMSDKKTTIV